MGIAEPQTPVEGWFMLCHDDRPGGGDFAASVLSAPVEPAGVCA